MMGLQDLPVEIVDYICIHLRDLGSSRYNTTEYEPAARKGLVSLCRTSKKVHLIALRHLYYHININDYQAPLTPLAKSLFKNQYLADLVREVDLEQRLFMVYDRTLDRYVNPLPVTCMQDEGTIYPDTRKSEAPRGSYPVRVLELLLSRLRKLRAANLDVHDDGLAQRVLRQIKHKDLREMTLRASYPGEQGLRLDSLVPLISATSIQKLTLWEYLSFDQHEHCNMPSLLEVRMMNAAMTSADFASLVDWCPNLQLLCYELGSSFEDGVYEDTASSAEISEELAPLHGSLETLILYQNFDNVWEIDAIEPLTDFTKLKTLIIGFHDLTGQYLRCNEEDIDEDDDSDFCKWSYMSLLPESLEHLYIVEAKHSLGEGLLELSSIAKNQCPHLKSVVVDKSFDLRALFKESGIDYREVSSYAVIGTRLGLGLEEFFNRCWAQLREDCKNYSRQDTVFNKLYTKSILPYCTLSEDQSSMQLGEG